MTTLFAFGKRELAQEVFIHVTQDILCFEALVLKRDCGDQVDQAAHICWVKLELGVGLVQHPFEFGVFLFDHVERIIDEFARRSDLIGLFFSVRDGNLSAWWQLGIAL